MSLPEYQQVNVRQLELTPSVRHWLHTDYIRVSNCLTQLSDLSKNWDTNSGVYPLNVLLKHMQAIKDSHMREIQKKVCYGFATGGSLTIKDYSHI